MKIVQQKTLYFSEGKSDKVYEVDLCESGDLFIVNFRYGRRGANLREGTKTVFPVPYEEALKVFNGLVTSKEKKGYSEDGVAPKSINTDNSEAISINTAREKTILKYLKAAVSGTYTRDWKVSRIIWRAAYLNITEAILFITYFINSSDEFEQYAAIYALSQFHDTSNANKIYDVFNTLGFENKVGRMAVSYTLKLGTESDKSKIISDAINKLPEELQQNIEHHDAFINTLAIYFLKDKGIDASVLYYAYLLSNKYKALRNQLYEFIEKLPLKANTFKSIRYIYRASHILEDVTFFALVSKRIGVSNPGYTSSYLYVNNEWIDIEEEKKKPNPAIAFSKNTKGYFNRTTYKQVYELSNKNETQYVRYVVALLTALDDKLDKKKEDIQYNYNYDSVSRRYITEKTYFPKYHDFLALMYILYGSSSRLQCQNSKWFYTEAVAVSVLPREEALPELWNSKPQEVLHILAHAKSEEAVQFALRIIQDNNHFLENIEINILGKLVSHYHPRVLDVILDVVENKYASVQPEMDILLALLGANNEKANALAFNWLKQYEANYFSNPEFILRLLLIGKEEVISYLKELYADDIKYKTPLSLLKLESLFKTPSVYAFEYLLLVNDLIGNTHFGKLLSTVSEERIKSLAGSTAIINKLFAANLAKHNSIPTYQLFKDSIDDYVNSEETSIRQVGIELLSHFPDAFLLENHQKISAFCFSEYDEVREAIQPTIERLINLDDNFKNNLFKALLDAIATTETYEGLHQNCYTLLVGNYKKYLSTISQDSIFNLVLSNYEFAQKLGLPLFLEHVDLNTLSIKDMVQLGDSDVFEIRETLRRYFEANTDKTNYELEDVLLIFNSTWQDVIDWSCAYFEKHIKPENWTVNMLLYACDHTKTDVQSFGRKMITKHFSDDKGLPLLLKLQEHPTKAMQFFVTNYLDNYAKDKTDVILKLESFFRTSLFNINTNRVTKTRIYTFLEQESIKDKAVAEMTVRLINAVLGTNTMRDRSNNIDVLLTIAEKHPDLDVPLLIKTN